jgi:hypothetical protein
MTVPEPDRGGTFFYCPWTEKHPGGGSACGAANRKRTGARFRTAAKYRRHWRRAHA